MYGFDSYTNGEHGYRYHYFDEVEGFTDVHSFDLAREVFRIMSKNTEGRVPRLLLGENR